MSASNHARWTFVTRRNVLIGIMVFAVAAVLGFWFGGRSRSRQPEWDSGLRDTKPRSPSRSVGQAPQAGSATDAGRSGSPPAREGGGGSTGKGGPGEGGETQEEGQGGAGSDGRRSSGGAADGSPNGGDSKGGPVAGNQPADAGGTGDDAARPPAALPGRPRPKPRYDAKTACEVAERRLRQAESNRADGDPQNAYAAALDAFEALEPHAATDDYCRQLLGRAKRMLAELAESQNRQTRSLAVPTYFE